VPGSFHHFIYAESENMKEGLSDHRPIAITLDVP
jgi:hypothetical protein